MVLLQQKPVLWSRISSFPGDFRINPSWVLKKIVSPFLGPLYSESRVQNYLKVPCYEHFNIDIYRLFGCFKTLKRFVPLLSLLIIFACRPSLRFIIISYYQTFKTPQTYQLKKLKHFLPLIKWNTPILNNPQYSILMLELWYWAVCKLTELPFLPALFPSFK